MRIIGLTGGIACGKSTVSAALAALGARIVDGDALSRELTAPGGPALPAIRAAFGDGVFHLGGTLNRRALAEVIFHDDDARRALDNLMQPMLRRLIEARIREAREESCPVCVLDMPLLYEAGLDALCDTVWCVSLPRSMQLDRLMARDGLNREQAEARLRSQLPPEEKARRAQIIIDTSGSIQYTKERLPALYERELALAKAESH